MPHFYVFWQTLKLSLCYLWLYVCAKYYGQCTLHLVSVEKILDAMFGFLFLIYCKYYIFLFYWTYKGLYRNSKKNVTNQSPLKKPQSTSTGNDYSVPYLGWFMDFIGGYFVQSIVDEFVRPKTSFILSFLTASSTEEVLNQFLKLCHFTSCI